MTLNQKDTMIVLRFLL